MSAFSELLDRYCARIRAREPMVIYRFGDGERLLMNGSPVGPHTQAARVDRWQAPAGLSALGRDLATVVRDGRGPHAHFGISCPCCDPASYEYYDDAIRGASPTFSANLFINANYRRWREFLASLDGPVAVVVNARANCAGLPFKTVDEMFVSDDCVNDYEESREQYAGHVRNMAAGLPDRSCVLVAAGPMSEPLMHFMYNERPDLTYVDVGSSLDEMLYGHQTRPYMNPASTYASRECALPETAGISDVDRAMATTERVWGFGGWSLSRDAIVALCAHLPVPSDAPVRVLELGGGQSTLFWSGLGALRKLSVTTIEHDEGWAAELRSRVDPNVVQVVHNHLKQLSDSEFEAAFEMRDPLASWDLFGRVLSPESNKDWTIHNAFYAEARLLGLQDASLDVLIVDGPHGNGRSLAYPLFKRALKSSALILIDDFDHYPFLDYLLRTMSFQELARGQADKRWVLVQRTP